MARHLIAVLFLIVLAAAVAACGDDDGEPPGFFGARDGDDPTEPADSGDDSDSSETEAAGDTATPGSEPNAPMEYEIQPGDTLSTIAAQFGTTAQAIAELNGIVDPAMIFPGDVILIPR